MYTYLKVFVVPNQNLLNVKIYIHNHFFTDLLKINPFTATFSRDLSSLQTWFSTPAASLAIIDKEHNNSPLLYTASVQGHLKIVEWLLSKNANVNATQGSGATPLHGAYNGHLEVCRVGFIETVAQVIYNCIDLPVILEEPKPQPPKIPSCTTVSPAPSLETAFDCQVLLDIVPPTICLDLFDEGDKIDFFQ